MFSLVEKEEIRLKYQYNINQIIPDLLYENKSSSSVTSNEYASFI